jgi:hypothetical protein
MQQPDDDGMATDDKRLREIAALLAASILRLRCRAALAAPAITTGSENPPDSSLNHLELTRETRLSVMRVDEVREPQNGRKT